MPKIEKDLLKVKGSDGQWHYVPAVGGSVDTAPTWDSVQDKPFSTLGGGCRWTRTACCPRRGSGGTLYRYVINGVSTTTLDPNTTEYLSCNPNASTGNVNIYVYVNNNYNFSTSASHNIYIIY